MYKEAYIHGLIYFDCSKETMFKRLMHRSITSGRSDDNPNSIEKRFDTFYA